MCNILLHVCTVHQQYYDTILLLQTDAHNYKIIGILKQLKFRLTLWHVSVHAGTIFRELSRAYLKLQIWFYVNLICVWLYIINVGKVI